MCSSQNYNFCVTKLSGIMKALETVEKLDSGRLMENGHMQGFRNWGPARRVGSPRETRTNPEE
jgi:hypothetical protein